MNVDKLKTFVAQAFVLASESKATRRKCAALLIRKVEGVYIIISSGVNGTAPGAPNVYEKDNVTLDSVIHAEVSCLTRAPEVRETDILVITDSPCEPCLRVLYNDYGIRNIVYGRQYRICEHLTKEEFGQLNAVHIEANNLLAPAFNQALTDSHIAAS